MNITQEMTHIQKQNELQDRSKLLDRVLVAYEQYLENGDKEILLSKLDVIREDAFYYGITHPTT
jgi:hypothetical protein